MYDINKNLVYIHIHVHACGTIHAIQWVLLKNLGNRVSGRLQYTHTHTHTPVDAANQLDIAVVQDLALTTLRGIV